MFNRNSSEAKRRAKSKVRPTQTATVQLKSEEMLATDDRFEYPSTPATELLAASILERARKSADEYMPGVEFSITITEPHPDVHETALMFALKYQASRIKGRKLTHLAVIDANIVQFRA